MVRNKLLGISSIVIGLVGLAIEFYFNTKAIERYEELGPLGELVTLFKYGDSNRNILLIFNLIGVIAGIIPIVKKRIWWSIIGIFLCSWNFFEVISYA